MDENKTTVETQLEAFLADLWSSGGDEEPAGGDDSG